MSMVRKRTQKLKLAKEKLAICEFCISSFKITEITEDD